MAYRVSREKFESLAEEALKTLPEKFRRYFENITITIEDYPDSEEIKRLKSERDMLLGIYSGVPYPEKRGFFNIPYPLPDRIILFQKNIEEICSSEKELIEQIQKTLIHEVGHYFGLSEGELRRYE